MKNNLTVQFPTINRVNIKKILIINIQENKPWFDLDCRFARQNYRKLKKRFKRSTSPQNRLAMIDAEKHVHSVEY
jgi:hypothetical protein